MCSLVFNLIHSDWALSGSYKFLQGFDLGVSYIVVRQNLWVTILAYGYWETTLIAQMYFVAGCRLTA